MKKVVMIFALLGIALQLSAQDSIPNNLFFELQIDLIKDAVYQRKNSGEFAEAAAYGTPNRTYHYLGNDALTFFNIRNEMLDTSEIYLKFGYQAEKFGGLIRFNLSPRSFDYDQALVISNLIDIYNAWGKIGFFKLWIGRDDYRGSINRYQNFYDTLGVDNFGPIIANFDYRDSRTLNLTGSDITNLGKDVQGFANTTLLAEFNFSSFFITLAANNLFSKIEGRGTNENQFVDNFTDTNSVFSARFEAVNLFDMLSLAAIYKFQYSDRKYELEEYQNANAQQSFFLPQMGIYHHQFGLFANFTLERLGLGISVGGSGYLRSHKDLDAPSWGGWESYKYPAWYGIDLRANYTGVEKLSITLNNNISFSKIKGDNDPTSYIYGFYDNYRGDPDVGENTEQNVFVLYNALAVAYNITENLTLRGEISNQFAKLVYLYNKDETRFIDTFLNLSGYAGIVWNITNFASLRAGATVRFKNYKHEDAALKSKGGILEWGIPIGVLVQF